MSECISCRFYLLSHTGEDRALGRQCTCGQTVSKWCLDKLQLSLSEVFIQGIFLTRLPTKILAHKSLSSALPEAEMEFAFSAQPWEQELQFLWYHLAWIFFFWSAFKRSNVFLLMFNVLWGQINECSWTAFAESCVQQIIPVCVLIALSDKCSCRISCFIHCSGALMPSRSGQRGQQAAN